VYRVVSLKFQLCPPPPIFFPSTQSLSSLHKSNIGNNICVSCCGFFRCYCLNLVVNKRIKLVKNIVNKPNLSMQLRKHEIFRLYEILDSLLFQGFLLPLLPLSYQCIPYGFLSFQLSKALRVAKDDASIHWGAMCTTYTMMSSYFLFLKAEHKILDHQQQQFLC
jgi:hypothetical protein